MTPSWGGPGARYLQAAAVVLVGHLLMPVGLFFIPIPVALYAAGRRPWAVVSLLVLSVSAGALAVQSVQGALFSATVAAVGVPVGVGLSLGWTYGRLVIVATVLMCVVPFAIFGFQWDDMTTWAAEAHEEMNTVLEGPDRAGLEEGGQLAVARMQAWLLGHWPYVMFGLTFANLLLLTCFIVSATAWWWSRHGGELPERFGAFRTFRPPDWLVWAVIGTAALWFIDQRWHSDFVRILAWNSAAGLAGVYWLNGLSVCVYGITVLRPPILLVVALALTIVFFNTVLLPFLGLFDTWAEWRSRMDQLKAAQHKHEYSDNDDS